MTRPIIVTPEEKKANATPPAKGGGCTSPRPQRLKAARKRDFASLVKSCIKAKMSKALAIEQATTIINANADLYTPAFGGPPAHLWGYSPTSPRPFAL